jgi:hypothetical protein
MSATRGNNLNRSNPETSDVSDRRWRIRYAVLTFALFAPLLVAFIFVRNLYPFAASTMMMRGVLGDAPGALPSYVLRGETSSGEIIDLAPVSPTSALSEVTWVLVRGTVDNKSFAMRTPHPANAALLESVGNDPFKLPRAARLNELLRSYGAIHNSRLPPSSPQRLRAVILSRYHWDARSYRDYQRFVESWRVEL